MQTRRHSHKTLLRAAAALAAALLMLSQAPNARAQKPSATAARASARDLHAGVSTETLLRIVRAEDERRWEEADLGALLAHKSAAVRGRAALAAGRIGDEAAVPALASLMRNDVDASVRATAAFALGEVESPAAADMLLTTLRAGKTTAERARALEALGKIAAALPATDEARRKSLGAAIVSAVESEQKSPRPDTTSVLLGLTALLRARPDGAGRVAAFFLASSDARVRADAANTLARLRAKDSSDKLRALLTGDLDPVVRANAARALGVAEDATALDALASRVASDTDLRVRVSAVRALAQLKDARAADPLLKRGAALLAVYRAAKLAAPDSRPAEGIELLEIATSVGRLLQNTNDAHALEFLRQLREAEEFGAPEVEGAFAHVAPTLYMRERPFGALAGGASRAGLKSWQSYSALAQGLGELAAATSAAGGNSVVSLKADAQILLLTLLNDPATPALAVPDVMRALATYKPASLAETVRAKLTADDVIVRATAADILAELDPDPANANALASALPRALSEELNDAALSILSALAHQKTAPAILAVKSALEVPDYVVRRRAESLLKELGAVGAVGVQTVATRNKEADYLRALSRIGRSVRARVLTDKGEFTLELLPAEAPLNVDNFVELARRGYFNNVTFHRVVPNFVVQGGDPRGDGNGGPGYQIRCEINTVPFARGAVGMALSGKDTGGSQWFITHSPQPHLDGGYTVFGRVVSGMEVVDRIARRDRILGVTITEGKPTATGGAQRPAARSR